MTSIDMLKSKLTKIVISSHIEKGKENSREEMLEDAQKVRKNFDNEDLQPRTITV